MGGVIWSCGQDLIALAGLLCNRGVPRPHKSWDGLYIRVLIRVKELKSENNEMRLCAGGASGRSGEGRGSSSHCVSRLQQHGLVNCWNLSARTRGSRQPLETIHVRSHH